MRLQLDSATRRTPARPRPESLGRAASAPVAKKASPSYGAARLAQYGIRGVPLGASDMRGLHVKIVARPDPDCWSCSQLEMVQVVRNTTTVLGVVVSAEPTNDIRKRRSGWGDPDAPSQGWRVDAADISRNPFYSQSWVGQSGDYSTPAILWDTPAGFETDRNSGKDFQSCLICVNGSSRISLGCATWGYMIDREGAITFQPQPAASCGATTRLRDATKRWDSLPDHQHVDLRDERPGRPAGETPQPRPPGGSGMG